MVLTYTWSRFVAVAWLTPNSVLNTNLVMQSKKFLYNFTANKRTVIKN